MNTHYFDIRKNQDTSEYTNVLLWQYGIQYSILSGKLLYQIVLSVMYTSEYNQAHS